METNNTKKLFYLSNSNNLESTKNLILELENVFVRIADLINTNISESREKSLIFTKLQEAYFFSVHSLIKDQVFEFENGIDSNVSFRETISNQIESDES